MELRADFVLVQSVRTSLSSSVVVKNFFVTSRSWRFSVSLKLDFQGCRCLNFIVIADLSIA